MTDIAALAASVFRDTLIEGDPNSGPFNPRKADIRALFASLAAKAPSKNRLINGSFAINQRQATSNADDTYCFDRWYVLTQTGAIAASSLTDPETGAAFGLRLTQSQASAQRFGLAQIIESGDCRDLRSAVMTLAGRVRLSTAANIRYAVLEWTGTANSVTSDIVADWTSTGYSQGGGFFNTTTLNVLAQGAVAASAATWRALTALNATAGASANNIIVFVWTESAAAQNVTLDFNRVQLEAGAAATAFEVLPIAAELARCLRFYEKSYDLATAPGASATAGCCVVLARGADQAARHPITFKAQKRVTPTMVIYSTTGATGNWRANGGTDLAAAITFVGHTQATAYPTTNTVSGEVYYFHFTADAEL